MTFSMSGGAITGNTAPLGGGVYMGAGTFELSCGESGCPEISGNTKPDGSPSNLYLPGAHMITITGPLSDGDKKALIGISLQSPREFTKGLGSYGDASNFFSDDPAYEVQIVNGEAALVLKSAATPEFSPDPKQGPFIGSVEVEITSETEGASIYYTTKGDTSTKDSTLYEGPFTITETTEIKAIAVKEGIPDSETATAEYEIEEADHTLEVSDLKFADVTFGYDQPEAQAVTITSKGNEDTKIDRAELGKTMVTNDGEEEQKAFDLKKSDGTTVKAGETDTSYTVQPAAGLGAGTYTADFTVYYDDTSASGEVSITVLKADDPLEVSVSEDDPTVPVYEEPEGTISETVSYSGTLEDGTEYGPSPNAPTKPGEYTVTVICETADTIYTGSADFTLTEPEPEPEPDRPHRLDFFRLWEDFELPATGFSSVRPTVLSEQPKELRYEPVRMRLMLPTLEQDIELVTIPVQENSWAVDWLGGNAGILAGSALPGEGISVIAAHNTLNDTAYGPFALLSTLEENDLIVSAADDGTLNFFRGYANELLAPDDLETIAALAEENSIVLVTCENEDINGGRYLSRRVVFAAMN